MKTKTSLFTPAGKPGLRVAGFTLIELLVVISIIAILAAMLLPVLQAVKRRAMIKQAQLEMAQIVNAIVAYESAYNRMPCSAAAMSSAFPAGTDSADFTYGTAGLNPNTIQLPSGAPAAIVSPGNYQTNNAEIMAILLDLEKYADGRQTINFGHVKNTQRTKFLNPKFVTDKTSPGVGADGVYRDPWGNPYIVTLDLNSDEKARDGFYSSPTVSQDATDTTGNRGLNGLYKTLLPKSGRVVFELNHSVMVWSAGPDKMVDPNMGANAGANKDNVLSWKQ